MKRKVIVFAFFAILLSSCTTSLYYWGGTQDGTTKYEALAYKNYDVQTPESICALLCLYEEMITQPLGTRHMPPPGICAEYGYLLLLPETATIFAEHATARQKKVYGSVELSQCFREKGLMMLKKEIDLYPESEKFIGPLLKRFK